MKGTPAFGRKGGETHETQQAGAAAAGGAVLHSPAGGLGRLEAFAKEAPALMTDESDGATAAQLLQETDDEWVTTATQPADAGSLSVAGKGAVLMELSSGQILFEQTPHEKVAIASVTKIMTLLLVMEALDAGQISLDDKVSCSATAASMGGSQIWLKEGEVMTVHELTKAAAVVSANDACAALAEHICGSIDAFVTKMNERAAQLGMRTRNSSIAAA